MTWNPENLKLVAGLGNPGSEFRDTYHNAGRAFVDYLTKELKAGGWKNKETFKYAEAGRLCFVQSLVHMNESGRALGDALKFLKVRPDEILLAHDESDLPLGKFKIAFGQGSAGHKGVESVVKRLQSRNFWRLRLGVRRADEKMRSKAGVFVLKKITGVEKKIIDGVFETAVSKLGVQTFLLQGKG